MCKEFFEELSNINDRLIPELEYLKPLSIREYLLWKKWEELRDIYISTDLWSYKSYLFSFNQLEQFYNDMENENYYKIKIRIVPRQSSEQQIWDNIRKRISLLTWSPNIGRLIRIFVYYDNRIVGILSIGSDMISLENREKYIGWDEKTKLSNLVHTAMASTIVGIQPLSYWTNLGKLLALLLYHKSVRQEWLERYGDVLVGITTTSLFGQFSQYSGMPKYWRPLGKTKGKMEIVPSDETYKLINSFLKKWYPNKFQRKITNPKNKKLKYFYQIARTYKKLGVSKLTNNYQKGIFFARFYETTKEFLRGETQELKPRKNLDFDINDICSIVSFWWKKWGRKRYNKISTIPNPPQKLFYLEFDEHRERFIKKYLKKEAD